MHVDVYIARQPIFNYEKQIFFGYELLFRNNEVDDSYASDGSVGCASLTQGAAYMGFLRFISGDVFARLHVRLGLVAPIGTGRISEGLYAVKTGAVNFYIYSKGDDYIALDSGIGTSAAIRELGKLGIDPRSVSAVFLSHSDFDHMGGLQAFSNATVYLSHAEEQMVAGKRVRRLCIFRNKRIRRSYALLKDSDEVAAGSIKIEGIETPGHTPGSMSYLIDDSILFVGDTFTLRKGLACPVARIITMDPRALDSSIRKLAALDNVKLALTSHRGYTDDFYGATLPYAY